MIKVEIPKTGRYGFSGIEWQPFDTIEQAAEALRAVHQQVEDRAKSGKTIKAEIYSHGRAIVCPVNRKGGGTLWRVRGAE